MRFAALSRAQKVGWWMGGREGAPKPSWQGHRRQRRREEGFLVAVDEGRERGGRARGGRDSVGRRYAD